MMAIKMLTTIIIVLSLVFNLTNGCALLQDAEIKTCIDGSGTVFQIESLRVQRAICSNEACDCTQWLNDNSWTAQNYDIKRNPCKCRLTSTKYVNALEKSTGKKIRCVIETECACQPQLEL